MPLLEMYPFALFANCCHTPPRIYVRMMLNANVAETNGVQSWMHADTGLNSTALTCRSSVLSECMKG